MVKCLRKFDLFFCIIILLSLFTIHSNLNNKIHKSKLRIRQFMQISNP